MSRHRAGLLLATLTALLAAAPAAARGAVDLGTTIVELEFRTFWVDAHPLAAPLAELVKQFNADNVGRSVVSIAPQPDAAEYANRTITRLSAGDASDIFVLHPDADHFRFYEGNLLMDLTDDLAGSWGQLFLPGAVEQATRRERTKSVPFEYALAPIWFNESLFKAAGINTFPRILADLWLAMERIRDLGTVPAAQAGRGPTSMLWFSHLAVSLGGRQVWQRPLDDPLYEQAALALQQMYRRGNTTAGAIVADLAAARAGYHRGETSMIVDDGTGLAAVRERAPAVHTATRLAYAPQVGDFYGFIIGEPLTHLAAGATADPRERAAAVSFLRWLTLPANLLLFTEQTGALFPVRYPAIRNIDPLLQDYMRITRDAAFVAAPLTSAWPTAGSETFAAALRVLVASERSPALFMQTLAAADG